MRLETIKDGIKIFLSPKVPLEDRAVICHVIGTPVLTNKVKYYPNAIIPVGPWVALTKTEQHVLFTDTPGDYSSHITVIKLPEELINDLAKLNREAVVTGEDMKKLYQNRNYKPVVENIITHFNRFQWKEGAYHANPIICNDKDLLTLTFDQRNDIFVGLHIDSWDGSLFKKRHQSSNRICLNIGLENRYLLFANLKVSQLIEIINDPQFEDSKDDTDLIAHFFKLHPNYPIIKLKIAPGEAYIAPTENMIHDGSTAGTHHMDLQLTIRGFFNYPNK